MLTTIRSLYVFSLFWLIKLILRPVNIVTIQKPDLVNMAGVSDALKPERFAEGDHFKRWQIRVNFWLMSTNIWWVIFLVLPLIEERNRAFELDNMTCIGCIVSLLSNQLCDVYMEYTGK
jgi:hypothetical protein